MHPTRRELLHCSLGAAGLALPSWLGGLSAAPSSDRRADGGRAKRCMVLYCWGGMSHHETWDLKPNAPSEFRGEFDSIASVVPGIRVGEHLPMMSRHTDKLAIIRSIHHNSSAHGKGMYWNWTGHAPLAAEVAVNQPPTRADWPSLGAIVGKFRKAPPGFPNAIQVPYPMVDNNTLQAGENAGFLGQRFDPVIVRPDRGKPWGGVSRDLGTMVINPAVGVDSHRLSDRQRLCQIVDNRLSTPISESFDNNQRMATDLLTSPRVQRAFSLDHESQITRDRYGDHLCGQSMLLGRRLLEAGVPIVTAICAAGDLNGASGDMWDTHGNNFQRLKRDLLPPFDRAFSALLQDMTDRGMLNDTLVVMLTEFGRTPRVNGSAGRDHYPRVYTVALAGGGIQGGRHYGSSDRLGAEPADMPCGPADLHATIYHALGIPTDAHLQDSAGRAFPLCEGRVLPLF